MVDVSKYDASQLRSRLKICNEGLLHIGAGSYDTMRSVDHIVWSKIEYLTGEDYLKFSKVESGKPVRVVIRYNPNLQLSDSSILEYKTDEMVIHSLVNVGQMNKWYEILAYAKPIQGVTYANFRLLEDGTARLLEG